MSIRIIADAERLSKSIEGATFYYRRIPAHVRAKIIDQNTNKRTGQVNWGAASLAILEHCVIGWEHVVDDKGLEIAFRRELTSYLPDSVQSDLVELFGANIDPQLEGEVKNSSGTPSSSSSTTI